MKLKQSKILHVALPVPVRHYFDYLVSGSEIPAPGTRVLVPFGGRKQDVGMVVDVSTASDIPLNRLKPVLKILDEQPLFPRDHLQLLLWASDYYHHPPGEVVFTTLPRLLRIDRPPATHIVDGWKITDTGSKGAALLSARATKQHAILQALVTAGTVLKDDELNQRFQDWRPAMHALLEKDYVTRVRIEPSGQTNETVGITLNPEQAQAIGRLREGLFTGARYLLDGVTGSGKTEIYIETAREVIARGRQALVLVPEIGLTPHFITRFRNRIGAPLAVLHSGLSDGERLQAWLSARDGRAAVILGTRSAVWTPLKHPGVFIIDEEHDPSYKQQDGFRYSARDIAILRADREGVPVISGSATPSLESLHKAATGKYLHLTLTQRAENARLPGIQVIDIRGQKISGAISVALGNAVTGVLDKGKQALLFLNRRGYSPVQLCHDCGWINTCSRCDLPMTYHKFRNRLLCHHCGSQAGSPFACPSCGESGLVPVGHGTERLSDNLEEMFPGARILRIDRDTTRRKGTMEAYTEQINAGDADILVGTQILAKGHHFPDVTLVGIIDADRGLYSADYRAAERMAQLITQVGGRAGRSADPGVVMIQTHFPSHPYLTTLMGGDYHAFARALLEERRAAGLPPFSYQALLRAEAHDEKAPTAFLQGAKALLRGNDDSVEVYGPFPAPFEKRAGRYRFQLMLQSGNRTRLQKLLRPWVRELETMKSGRKIRWSLDVDPQEML